MYTASLLDLRCQQNQKNYCVVLYKGMLNHRQIFGQRYLLLTQLKKNSKDPYNFQLSVLKLGQLSTRQSNMVDSARYKTISRKKQTISL